MRDSQNSRNSFAFKTVLRCHSIVTTAICSRLTALLMVLAIFRPTMFVVPGTRNYGAKGADDFLKQIQSDHSRLNQTCVITGK